MFVPNHAVCWRARRKRWFSKRGQIIFCRRCRSLFGSSLWNRYISITQYYFVINCFNNFILFQVSRVIVLSQFVSIYALPVFVLLHCGGMFYWQYRKYIVPNEISHKIPVHKLAVNFSWLGFVNIFNFVGFTFTPQSDGRMKLSFTLKDMFLNYKYFAVNIVYTYYINYSVSIFIPICCSFKSGLFY